MNKVADYKDHKTTEERILKAAEREFLDKGYAGARTTSIAEAAGVTHAMLHYYFRSKDRLFKKILCDKVKYLRGIMLLSLLNSDMPIIEKVKSAIISHLDFLAKNPELPRFMLNVISGYPEFASFFKEKLQDDNHDILGIFQAEIDKNAALGLCRRMDARTLLLDIMALNVFSFIASPLINIVIGEVPVDADFLEERKKNNIEIILQKMKP